MVLCDDTDQNYLYIFFFKQKTAYEMRISDWSSDVCSSDLKYRPLLSLPNGRPPPPKPPRPVPPPGPPCPGPPPGPRGRLAPCGGPPSGRACVPNEPLAVKPSTRSSVLTRSNGT